jgi:hypothetical protein
MSGTAIFIASLSSAGRAHPSVNERFVLQFSADDGTRVAVTPEVFVIAGYTGRDRAMVQAHIDELDHEVIAPPQEVPMLYPMPVEILTTAPEIGVSSAQSCGELEPVIVGVDGALYLGCGSDHTARDVEREDIATSKRVCPKPLGSALARIAAFDATFDAIVLESAMDGEPYQRGTFAQIAPLATLLELFRSRNPAAKNFVLFCGTVPLLGGAFRFGKRFSGRLSGGPLTAPLALDYQIS